MEEAQLDELCGKHRKFRDLIECCETWHKLAKHPGTGIDNRPKSPVTYQAMRDLCEKVLDPVITEFGPIELTYAFASAALHKQVSLKPKPNTTRNGDRHAGCEINRIGNPFCKRLGQGVDFRLKGQPGGMFEVAHWIVGKTPFDRLYFYADHRPIHVSYGPDHTRYAHRLPKALPKPQGSEIDR